MAPEESPLHRLRDIAMTRVPIAEIPEEGLPLSYSEDPAEDYYYQDDVVVLDDLVRQEVILAVPFSPQCRADCRGLCPQCGQDLNVGACACAPPPDPRWAALREYLKGK